MDIFNKTVTIKGKISEVTIEGKTSGQGNSDYTSTFLIGNQKVSFYTCFYNNEELIVSGIVFNNVLVAYVCKELTTNKCFHGNSFILDSIWFVFGSGFILLGLGFFCQDIIRDAKIIENLNIGNFLGLFVWIAMIFEVSSICLRVINTFRSRISCWIFERKIKKGDSSHL